MSTFKLRKGGLSKSDPELQTSNRRVLKRRNQLCKTNLAKSDTFLQELNVSEEYVGECQISNMMARTYSSEVYGMNGDMVVKVPLNMTRKRHIRNLSAEIEILREIDSPRIVKYFGTISNNSIDNKVGIVLERCENGDLHQYLSNIDEDSIKKIDIKNWLKCIFSAIEYIHDKDIVHRDIKSPNFLVDIDINLKLADFGLARKNTTENKDKTLRKLRTSSYWTAPELLVDEEPLHTKASDIFAGTIVSWEVLNFHYSQKYSRPFETTNMYCVIRNIMNGDRPIVDKSFTKECKVFLEKGWHQDQRERPDAKSMLEDISKLEIYKK